MGVIMEAVMIKGCIFDLDGTLVDSLKGSLQLVQIMLWRHVG